MGVQGAGRSKRELPLALKMLGHGAAFGLLSLAVLSAYHVIAEAAAGSDRSDETSLASNDGGGLGDVFRQMTLLSSSSYDLSALSILKQVDRYIDGQYVDPQRFDHDKMFHAALDAVEQLVPEAVLRADSASQQVYIEVGSYKETMDGSPVKSFRELESRLGRVASLLEARLDPKEVVLAEIEYAMINGVLGTLDPHSVFLPPENSKKMEEDNEGEFGGLGITIVMRENVLTVEYPLEDTPAYREGLQANDRIVRIDGERTLNMDLEEAVSKMRGRPGVPVTLTIERDTFTEPRDITITRAVIKPTQLWGVVLDGAVAYVRIDSFHAHVESQLGELMARLSRDVGPTGLKGIVLDLRGNPGGYLLQSVAVADYFLTEGVIVSTVDRGNKRREEKRARDSGTESAVPIAVLMSGTSASAAEIVAGALRNNERAVIIGERSFGKGSVQNLYDFTESKLKLTVQRYLTPGDRSIQSVGIPPDIALDRSVVAPPTTLKSAKVGTAAPGSAPLGTKAAEVTTAPRVSLFYRQNQPREADLDGHLLNEQEELEPAAYRFRYLYDIEQEDSAPKTDRKDVKKDFEVILARDVLLAARGSRRAEVLRDAEKVVNARRDAEQARIHAAFKELGIDWSNCAPVAEARLSTQFAAADGKLYAASDDAKKPLEPVTLTVTNTGDQPLCRVAARSKSGNDRLDGLEYYFGRLEPGQSRSYTQKVSVPDGYPLEDSHVDFEFVDTSELVVARADANVRTEGVELPRYAWSWSFDDREGGDGDGLPEVGETIQMRIDVMNVGKGVGGKAVLSLKKRPGLGKVVELDQAEIEVVGLGAGERTSGAMLFRVTAAPPDGKLPFELRIMEEDRYDYGSVVKGGFYPYFSQSEEIDVSLGVLPPAARREPPAVELSRRPPSSSTDERVTLSGVATDDIGVRDVIVYHGAQKVAYFGGDGSDVRSIPFSVSVTLGDDNNLLVVLVRDVDGFTTTQSVDVFHHKPATAATLAPSGG